MVGWSIGCKEMAVATNVLTRFQIRKKNSSVCDVMSDGDMCTSRWNTDPRERTTRAPQPGTGGEAERDDSAGAPDAVEQESQINLFVLENCEGMDGISEVDAAQVNA